MLDMVVEHYRDPRAVYQRLAERGRMAPEGLQYISSWVDQSLRRCFQVMEASDPLLLQRWIARWEDLVEFEVVPVVTSLEAAQLVREAP